MSQTKAQSRQNVRSPDTAINPHTVDRSPMSQEEAELSPEIRAELKRSVNAAFMLGVDWMCKVIAENAVLSKIYNFDKQDAKLFHERAEKILSK